MCAYKIDPQTGKRTNKRTVNYCEKCEKYVCENCFKDFHTRSSI
jgi:B-box zinc finger.